MPNLSLASILLFVLVIPFIMTYRLGPGEIATPYWLFGVIFALLLANLVLDLLDWPRKKINLIKSVLLWLMIVLVIGSAYASAIIVRHQTSPTYQIHDMPLQLESAIRFFLQGKNPYATDYFGTPLEAWHYSDKGVNPALYHLVMMPWSILFSLPFYLASVSFLGFFDGRMSLLFLFAVLLILAWKLLKRDQEKQRLLVTLLAFNPATLGYFLEGRTDILMFTFLFLAWYWLQQKRYALASLPMALAFATKQSAWPIFPFYLAFLWFKEKRDWQKVVGHLFVFSLVFGLVVLPFFFWGPKAFLESTIFYLAGNLPDSYPIAGYGWGMLLHQAGVIKDLGSYYPFWLWQLLTCLPLGFGLLYWLAQSTTVRRLIISYGLLTFVFWYLSRYFNNSHLGYLSMVFLTAVFWPEKDGQKV